MQIYCVIDSTKNLANCHDMFSYYFNYLKEIKLESNFSPTGIHMSDLSDKSSKSEQKGFQVLQFQNDSVEDSDSCKFFEMLSRVETQIKLKKNLLYESDGLILKDQIEGYSSILTGMNELIGRYNSYIQQFNIVYKVQTSSVSNNYDGINRDALSKELKNAKDFKKKFEDYLIQEIDFFKQHYSNAIEDIKTNFYLYLKNENKFEYNQLRTIKCK